MCVFFWAFMFSTCFSKARTASTFGALIYFASFFTSFAVTNDSPTTAKTWIGIFFSVAQQLGGFTINNLEVAGGVTYDNINSHYLNYSVGICLNMFIFDCFLYLGLGLYFNQVIPSDTGVHQPWYFLCSKRYWRSTCQAKDAAPADDVTIDTTPVPAAPFIEASPSLTAGVNIRGLRKEFPPASSGSRPFVAVDGLDLDLYEGQILSLLGHNGAGKTTTISMLTGLTTVTSGDAMIQGLSLKSSISNIRPRLGVCPQHDILWPLLTVTEHLQMYAAIKGIQSDDIPKAVTDMIELVGLTEKANALSASLSGMFKNYPCQCVFLVD
jgi:ATP-binding cassette subfamily A (ABC1) protein 3